MSQGHSLSYIYIYKACLQDADCKDKRICGTKSGQKLCCQPHKGKFEKLFYIICHLILVLYILCKI